MPASDRLDRFLRRLTRRRLPLGVRAALWPHTRLAALSLGGLALFALLLGQVLTAGPSAHAEQDHHRVLIDGDLGDWPAASLLAHDALGDGAASDSAADFGTLHAAHDSAFLLLRVTFGREQLLQSGHTSVLFLDLDGDATTGLPGQARGAEVVYRFGDRAGEWLTPEGEVVEIDHADLGLVTAPTVADSVFEIALARRPIGTVPSSVTLSDTVGLALADQQPGGDMLPDVGTLRYDFAGEPQPQPPVVSLGRPEEAALRLVTYNVLRDRLLEPEAQPAFRRILQALGPDVLGLQEVYESDESAIAETLDRLAPLEQGSWHVAKEGLDLVLASRYPIEQTYFIGADEERRGAGAFLLDTEDALGEDLLALVVHPPCCTGGQPDRDSLRQAISDAIAAFLRDVRQPDGPLGDLDQDLPLVVLGDMNFVGDPGQLLTLLTGRIVNEDRFGPSTPPDTDGTTLTDAHPRTTGLPMTFTWFDPESSFSPGRLDYVLYSDARLDALHGFTLFTPTLPPSVLDRYDLRPDDTTIASDHLPVVVDVRLRP